MTLGFAATPGDASGIAVAGTFAYVADGETGLAVVDISDPRAPALVRVVATPGWAGGVRIASGLAYVTVRPLDRNQPGPSRFELFDLENPGNPQHIGSTELPGRADGVWVLGTRTYVADWDLGLTVVDVESPEAPQALRTIETPGDAQNVCVSGDLAFVADGLSGLTIIDLLSTDHPILTTVDLPHFALNVHVSEGVAYATCRLTGIGFWSPCLLVILDVRDPGSVEIIGTHELPGPGLGLCIVKSWAYVGAGYGGMRIIAVEDPAQPREVGLVEAPIPVRTVAISKGTALVGDNRNRISVIDIEDPERPSIPHIIEVAEPGYIGPIVVAGDLAYTGTPNGLSILDFANPRSPQVLGSVPIPDGVVGTAVSDRLAYVNTDRGFPLVEGHRLFVVDISDPEKPRIISSISSTSGFAGGVAESDGVAYVATGNGLRLIDVRDAEDPREIDFLLWPDWQIDPSAAVLNVTVFGDFAYVGHGDGAVSVVSVADPGNSRVVATVSIPGQPEKIVVDRQRAYVVQSGGLSVIDIEEPARPRVIGSVTSPCGGMDLAAGGGYAYVAAGTCGLKVIDISSCRSSASLFRRGDTNSDRTTDIADAIFTLSYLFADGPAPSCLGAADANDDGAVDIADAIAVLSHLFAGAGELPEPFGECGVDPTVDALECGVYTPCQS
jgi:hypothetical protein